MKKNVATAKRVNPDSDRRTTEFSFVFGETIGVYHYGRLVPNVQEFILAPGRLIEYKGFLDGKQSDTNQPLILDISIDELTEKNKYPIYGFSAYACSAPWTEEYGDVTEIYAAANKIVVSCLLRKGEDEIEVVTHEIQLFEKSNDENV